MNGINKFGIKIKIIVIYLILLISYIGYSNNNPITSKLSKFNNVLFPAPAVVIKFFHGNENAEIPVPNIDTKEEVRKVIDNIYNNCIRTVIIVARGDDVGSKYSAKAYYKSHFMGVSQILCKRVVS